MATAVLSITSLASCGHETRSLLEQDHTQITDPAKRHPINVVAEHAELEIPLIAGYHPRMAAVSLETIRFARRYASEGRGSLRIAVPHHDDHNPRHSKQLRDLHKLLVREGISQQQVEIIAKHGNTITLAYDRMVVVGPVCGDWSEDVTRNRENVPYPNYGCASQRNLASMIANPTDAVFAAKEAPRGSDRRTVPRKSFVESPPAKASLIDR